MSSIYENPVSSDSQPCRVKCKKVKIMRRDFDLPEEDEDFLESLGRPWETVRDGGAQWLLLHEFPFPDGYNHATGSIAIAIPSGYRTAQLDMAYFNPALARL